MKIKLGNVLEINNVLKSIIDNTELKIDALFKFKLLGIMKSFEIPIANFEIIRNEKIKEYGKELKMKMEISQSELMQMTKRQLLNFRKILIR